MFKKIAIISALIVSSCLISARAQAATITPGPLTITYDGDGAIFSESNLSPGNIVKRTLSVTNNGRIAHNFAMSTSNVSGDLGSVITLSAIENGNIIWTNTLLELQNLSTQSKFVTNLNPGETKTIALEANFPSSSGSSLAGKNVTFDIVYGTEEAEPAARVFGIFSTNPISSATPAASPSASAAASSTSSGEVKGESTGEQESGLNPWYLVIAPAAVLFSVVFLPEFALAGGLAAATGGIAYVLGYSSRGDMDPLAFYIILILEIITLIVLAYYLLHHDNRASRKIRGHYHRFRLR